MNSNPQYSRFLLYQISQLDTTFHDLSSRAGSRSHQCRVDFRRGPTRRDCLRFAPLRLFRKLPEAAKILRGLKGFKVLMGNPKGLMGSKRVDHSHDSSQGSNESSHEIRPEGSLWYWVMLGHLRSFRDITRSMMLI